MFVILTKWSINAITCIIASFTAVQCFSHYVCTLAQRFRHGGVRKISEENGGITTKGYFNVCVKPPFWAPTSYRRTPNFGRPFSNLAHFRTCGKVWLSSFGWLSKDGVRKKDLSKGQWPSMHTHGPMGSHNKCRFEKIRSKQNCLELRWPLFAESILCCNGLHSESRQSLHLIFHYWVDEIRKIHTQIKVGFIWCKRTTSLSFKTVYEITENSCHPETTERICR